MVWRGSKTLSGAVVLFNDLRRLGKAVAFATNNSSKTPAQYVERLRSIGIAEVEERDIVTSGVVTAAFLKANYPTGTSVHVLGSPALKELIADAGLELVDDLGPEGSQAQAEPAASGLGRSEKRKADVVVASIDRDLSYTKLASAASAILAGADFIGTNGDPNLPTENGLLPGSGSIIAALEVATGRRAKLMGKPAAPLFEHALRVLGSSPERTLMIGDRLDTDILGARRASLRTALVLTGSTSAAALDEALANATARPDIVCRDLGELAEVLQAGRPAPQQTFRS